MKKNGFTLAEVLISMGITSVLVLLMFKILSGAKPNEEQLFLKKSHHELTRVVHELINDDDLYPDVSGSGIEGQYLANTTQGGRYKGRTYSGRTKFCDLFGTRLSLRSSNMTNGQCNQNATLDNGGHYTTTDGVVWLLPITTFRNGNNTTTGIIQIDVNGVEEGDGDNCFEFEDEKYGSNPKIGCKLPDRFRFTIYSDGRIEVPKGDIITAEYLSSSNTTKSYKDLRKGEAFSSSTGSNLNVGSQGSGNSSSFH